MKYNVECNELMIIQLQKASKVVFPTMMLKQSDGANV